MKEKSRVEKVIQSFALLLIITMLLVVGFFAGTFSANFNNGLCYSASINIISNKALDVASSKSDKEILQFKQDMAKLPLWGYETSCPELLNFLKAQYPHTLDTRSLSK